MYLFAFPFLQMTGLIYLVDKNDFPFQIYTDLWISLLLQNVPVLALQMINNIILKQWHIYSIICVGILAASAFANIV